jgi:hypothetical protein
MPTRFQKGLYLPGTQRINEGAKYILKVLFAEKVKTVATHSPKRDIEGASCQTSTG